MILKPLSVPLFESAMTAAGRRFEPCRDRHNILMQFDHEAWQGTVMARNLETSHVPASRFAAKALGLLVLGVLASVTITPHARAADAPSIRETCMLDVKRFCAGIMPGSERLLTCMKRNESSLNSGCKTALAAVGGLDGPLQACAIDRDKFCPGTRGEEAAACFKANVDKLSPECRDGFAAAATK